MSGNESLGDPVYDPVGQRLQVGDRVAYIARAGSFIDVSERVIVKIDPFRPCPLMLDGPWRRWVNNDNCVRLEPRKSKLFDKVKKHAESE